MLVDRQGVLWWPDSLAAEYPHPKRRAEWSYVLLEEIVGSVAELCRWPWPLVDQGGRLFWLGEDVETVHKATVLTETLHVVLYQPDLERRPRAGDTFAATGSSRRWPTKADVPLSTSRELKQLFTARIVDISADSRQAAKLAYLGAAVSVHDRERDMDAWEADQLRSQQDQVSGAPNLRVSAADGRGSTRDEDLA